MKRNEVRQKRNQKNKNFLLVSEDIKKEQPPKSATSSAIIEILEPFLKRKEYPLKFWADNVNLYPNFTKVVRKRFFMVSKPVPCE